MEGANKINSAGKNAAREATEATDKSESINIYLCLIYSSRIIPFKTDFFQKQSVYFLKNGSNMGKNRSTDNCN